MVYQDHLTKFVVIKPLKTKTAEEVAYNLIDIFTLLGAPSILQSDNGCEFSNQIVSNLKNYWPNLKIVHGKPRHSQKSLLKLVDHNFIGPTNQDDENNITNDEDNITSIDEDICTVDNNINTGNFKDDENIANNDEDIITTINEDICTVDNSINKGNYLVCSEENDKNMVQCLTCDSKIHASGIISVEKDLLYKLCIRTKKIENQRKEAHCNLKLQAINMKTRSNKKFPPALVGNTVRVPISNVDRGRGEAHNVLACVLEVTEDGFYRYFIVY
eukprot:XP_008187112.2 PREDICTED: uncharacterized protein LOC100575947 [Acyrthosiphon pisum]